MVGGVLVAIVEIKIVKPKPPFVTHLNAGFRGTVAYVIQRIKQRRQIIMRYIEIAKEHAHRPNRLPKKLNPRIDGSKSLRIAIATQRDQSKLDSETFIPKKRGRGPNRIRQKSAVGKSCRTRRFEVVIVR